MRHSLRALKNQPHWNNDQTETSTMSKHRPCQNTYNEGPASLVTRALMFFVLKKKDQANLISYSLGNNIFLDNSK